jgi:acyl carrier protein
MDRQNLRELIEKTLKLISPKAKIQISDDLALFAADGVLDSIRLASFLLEVEQQLLETSGVSIRLLTDKALSRKVSPFSTVGSLIDFILEQESGA